ncbi:hypothetical protein CEXT_209321 [Caerostris extrusa]|uniref:Uncharacterized protein n=1 Tax=Caerostris extrusa TaxID=172846 RepID=A0AAV4TZC9_CAEEX|nr:hypothetical protein CEXT_209321 [Caerostris extrusa]
MERQLPKIICLVLRNMDYSGVEGCPPNLRTAGTRYEFLCGKNRELPSFYRNKTISWPTSRSQYHPTTNRNHEAENEASPQMATSSWHVKRIRSPAIMMRYGCEGRRRLLPITVK